MTTISGWLRLPWPIFFSDPGRRVDLGDGHSLPVEDVLEGHFRRLAAQRSKRSTANVAVQIGEHLTAAITVLAPDLAPLTELAEEVAQVVPSVQPAPQFRQHLHQALERTHRQRAAQRVLGTRSPARSSNRHRSIHPGLVIVMGLLVGALLAYLGSRSRGPTASTLN